jgi:RNA polymerase sigma factor, sigma-70 family
MMPEQIRKAENPIQVEEHIGLVHLCAKRFSGRGIEYDDIFQAGCLGLIKAAANFEAERGNKFSTYAVSLILGEMKGIFRGGGPVKISRGMRELAQKVKAESDKIREETGAMPSVSALAERLEISIEKAALAISASMPPVSLTSGEDSAEMQIPVEAPEEKLTDHMSLCQIMQSLEEKDRALIKHRYYQGKTQKETACILGMTQVQVSRREKKLLQYMRLLL